MKLRHSLFFYFYFSFSLVINSQIYTIQDSQFGCPKWIWSCLNLMWYHFLDVFFSSLQLFLCVFFSLFLSAFRMKTDREFKFQVVASTIVLLTIFSTNVTIYQNHTHTTRSSVLWNAKKMDAFNEICKWLKQSIEEIKGTTTNTITDYFVRMTNFV